MIFVIKKKRKNSALKCTNAMFVNKKPHAKENEKEKK